MFRTLLGWLRRNRADAPSGQVPHVDTRYESQTASEMERTFRSEDEVQRYIRESFLFTQYMTEGMKCANTDRKTSGKVYEVYSCDCLIEALRFLRSIPCEQIPPLYYVIVETPQANVGKDLEVIFNEATGETISSA